MKLDSYINQLLFQYDCVIVPNLGGFVANYKAAFINPVKDTFYPPSKSISFNKNLTHNDGLLVNYISRKDGLNYDQALKLVEKEVISLQHQLKNREKINLESIGTLFYDSENRLQFEPSLSVNYLLESYGLSPFQQFPIQRKTLESILTEKVSASNSSSKSNYKWIAAAAVTVSIAVLSIWIPSKFNINSDINYAHLNPFKSIVPTYTTRTIHPTFQQAEPFPAIDTENNTITFLKNETPIQLVESITKVDSTYVEIKQQSANFYIVGGCFADKNNADKFVQELTQSGFNATIIGKRKGLYTVCYGGYSTLEDAQNGLVQAKNHNSKAWLLSL